MGTTIWAGLILGAVYALVAAGFNLSLLPSGVFNFAQGAIAVGGSFLTYQWLSVAGIPMGVALLINAVAGAGVGMLCELLTVRPLRAGRRAIGGHSELVTTVGMSTVLVGLIGLKWGYLPLRVPFHGPSGSVHFLGIVADPVEIVLLVFAIVVTVGLHVWFKLTRIGQACLAVSEDREAAMLRGINVNLLSLGGFAAAGALGGVAGALTGPITYAIPTLANSLALGGFVAIALGGEGSFLGALVGGLLVGLISSFATRYLGANYANLSILAALLITLAARPRGIGGMAAARHV
jgi:branched-chain amino acid transport system permease protein